MSDERYGLPSASGMERRKLCPGSWNAEHGLPEETSPEADGGIRIHAALAKALQQEEGWSDDLSPEEVETANLCLKYYEKLLNQIDLGDYQVKIEKRMCYVSDDGDPVWSGKADVVVLDEWSEHCVVIDWKTGRGQVQDASQNMQLRALAVLASESYTSGIVTVAIIQPHGTPNPVTLCTYYKAELNRADVEINDIVSRSIQPDAPRIAGPDQCRYCRAKGDCPEYEAWVSRDLPMVPRPLPLASDWTPEQWAQFLEWAPVADDWLAKLLAQARKRLADDPTSIPGWVLRSQKRRSITDAVAVYERVSKLGVTAEQFGAICKVSLSSVKCAVREASGLKGKELTSAVNQCLEGLVAEKEVTIMEQV